MLISFLNTVFGTCDYSCHSGNTNSCYDCDPLSNRTLRYFAYTGTNTCECNPGYYDN